MKTNCCGNLVASSLLSLLLFVEVTAQVGYKKSIGRRTTLLQTCRNGTQAVEESTGREQRETGSTRLRRSNDAKPSSSQFRNSSVASREFLFYFFRASVRDRYELAGALCFSPQPQASLELRPGLAPLGQSTRHSRLFCRCSMKSSESRMANGRDHNELGVLGVARS